MGVSGIACRAQNFTRVSLQHLIGTIRETDGTRKQPLLLPKKVRASAHLSGCYDATYWLEGKSESTHTTPGAPSSTPLPPTTSPYESPSQPTPMASDSSPSQPTHTKSAPTPSISPQSTSQSSSSSAQSLSTSSQPESSSLLSSTGSMLESRSPTPSPSASGQLASTAATESPSTGSASIASTHRSIVGPAVGGAVGGLVGLLLIGVAIWLCYRRRRVPNEATYLSPSMAPSSITNNAGHEGMYEVPTVSRKVMLYVRVAHS